MGAALLPALLYPNKAFALLPDEEDEDQVAKAKANRRARLAQQRGVTRDFMASENLKDVRLEKELVPVQKAIYNLAKSGAELEAGDVKGAASTLSGPWVAEFSSVSATVSGKDVSAKLTDAIKGVQAAAAAGDLNGSKRLFIILVSDLDTWVEEAGLSSSLKGL
ncbi:hypothetical protein GPECTOR_3g491 [Gonium pectorale]|uniref:Maintenance of Photosystem II under High light 2 C-terminal domain-containing protein n=1 Tax=Gonium pectorale TaxID=33097 RepID=A0A150H060_GONPE|nr:hypothetical protein GPECTOR_3g491 [Gonium pectorale]|eukprot:KXZ55362.1 hypothetical protein GPECTOR_3g491 [Gonium pectorale]